MAITNGNIKIKALTQEFIPYTQSKNASDGKNLPSSHL